MFNSIFNKLLLVGTVCVVVGSARPARAEQIWQPRQLLSQQFHASERVTNLRVSPTAEQRTHIEARTGHALPKATYTFFVATTHGHVDGYALFDDQLGQHEPISFATFFDPSGRVTRVEVVAYREAYGDGIRGERFRKQFVGRSVGSGFRPGDDIDAVSGATISSRSMCIGVQRATALFEELVGKSGATKLAASQAGTPALASR